MLNQPKQRGGGFLAGWLGAVVVAVTLSFVLGLALLVALIL